jgi:hypothetical protein
MFFTCFYLFYSQIWLNNLVEDRQLSIQAVEPHPVQIKIRDQEEKNPGSWGISTRKWQRWPHSVIPINTEKQPLLTRR